MDIEEIQKKKKEVESNIANLLSEFMKETKLQITEVEIACGTIGYGQKAILSTKIKVEL